MTTPRPALDTHSGTALPAVNDPDGETLTRVLDGLRDLPQQPRPRRSTDDGADDADTGATAAVPLPRRRRAPSLGRLDRPLGCFVARDGDSGGRTRP